MPIWMCLLTGVLAAVIDWSGVGPHALRDRFAAILYLASALGWSEQLGIAAWEASMLAPLGHDARVIWAMAAVVPLGFWVGAMVPAIGSLGRFGRLQFRQGASTGAGSKFGGGKAAAGGDRINGWLLGWTLAVAAAVPITMPAAAYSAIVAAITGTVTTTGTAIGTVVGSFFGWL
jgi:hypothetical protein